MKFKIIFSSNDLNSKTEICYRIPDTSYAQQWIKKIKHLKNFEFSYTEGIEYKFDLNKEYTKFCGIVGIDAKKYDNFDQKDLNDLHELYENYHDKVSNTENYQTLYDFHHAIHDQEFRLQQRNFFHAGWGKLEGPLETEIKSDAEYAPTIKKDNIYLRWSELGKTPYHYWKNSEPNNLTRFLELAKPHQIFRARFSVALNDFVPPEFDEKFLKWFSRYKTQWLEKYQRKEWNNLHEFSGILVAEKIEGPGFKHTLEKFGKIDRLDIT